MRNFLSYRSKKGDGPDCLSPTFLHKITWFYGYGRFTVTNNIVEFVQFSLYIYVIESGGQVDAIYTDSSRYYSIIQMLELTIV